MIRNLYHFLKEQWQSFLLIQSLKRRFPDCTFESGLKIKGPLKNLTIGREVQIQSNVLFHLGGMEWCANQGYLKIGEKSCISPNVIIYAAGPGGVDIGENLDCGPGVKIFSSRSDINKRGQHIFGKIKIGDNVIFFANVVISPGVSIGDNAVILAGAIVNKDVPSNTVYGGIPAIFIKKLD